MKRQTFVDYIGVIGIVLCTCFVCAFYSMIMYFVSPHEETFVITNSHDSDVNDTVVVIDPGHGGEDGGAVGVSGVLEKDINLAISQYIHDFFVFIDTDCVLTRKDDILLYESGQENRKKYHDVRNRVRIANAYDNPLFVSIHQNKFPMEKYFGLQVYYSSNNKNSQIIADSIQSNNKMFLQPDNNRKTKEAVKSIYVLDALKCPAVLVECGFLSNSREEGLLSNEDYQKKIAFIIFKSLIEHFATDNTSLA
ncbi:MAG: hypothetical protein E7600_05970 [Ruminococcaceae bacterium]|nr:hypothetical protein [Oscillospiraceae bacterium]